MRKLSVWGAGLEYETFPARMYLLYRRKQKYKMNSQGMQLYLHHTSYTHHVQCKMYMYRLIHMGIFVLSVPVG